MFNDKPNQAAGKTVRRRWVRATLVSLCVVSLGLGYLAYSDLTSPERVRALAHQYLQRFARGDVHIGAASFSWFQGITLWDVTVSDPKRSVPPEAPDRQPTFSCRELRLDHDPWSVFSRRWRIRSVVALEPACRIVRDVAEGGTNLTGFFKTQSPGANQDRFELPSIELRDARLQMVYREHSSERTVEQIVLSVRGIPSEKSAHQYDIVWKSGARRQASGRARLHLDTGHLENVRGGLPWISLESVIVAVSARSQQAGQWCDLLGLEGSIRVRDFHLNLGAGEAHRPSAVIELNRASLSIPVNDEEKSLAPQRRYLRFKQVHGTISVAADALTADFEGSLHGSRCKVTATLGGGMESFGSLDEIAFNVNASLKGFSLPRIGADAPGHEQRFVAQWARLAKFYRNYDPHGVADISIAVAKPAGAGAPLKLSRLLIDGRGADARARWFPYRVFDIHGQVEYGPDGVFVKGITGRHGEGRIAVDAFLAGAKSWTAVKLHARGTNILVDDDLLAALPTRYHRAYATVNPAGTLDVDVDLQRPDGQDETPAPWESHIALGFTNLSACHEDFPYPLSGLAGDVLIDPGHVQIADVSCTHGKAKIALDGVLRFDRTGTRNMVLEMHADHVPIDPRLIAALPSGLSREMREYDPVGRFSADTIYGRNGATDESWYAANVTLEDATIRPRAFPVTLSHVGGQLTLKEDQISLQGVHGRYGEGTITAEGVVQRMGDRAEVDVSIRARDVLLDESLRTAAPPRLRELLAAWQVDGPMDADTTMRSTAGDEADSLAFSTVVSLDDVTVQHALFPKPFEHVRATVRLNPELARAEAITAEYAGADIAADVEIAFDEHGHRKVIVLKATGLRLDDSIRGILPPPFRDSWDRRTPTGSVDLSIDRLEFMSAEGHDNTTCMIDGRIDLHDVSLSGAAAVSHLNGRMTIHGPIVDREGGCAISGKVEAQSAELFGWPVREAEADWVLARLADGTGQYSISELHGTAHGGALTGRLDLRFDNARSDYTLSTTVHDIDVSRILSTKDSATEDPQRQETAELPRGRMDANLYLAGEFSDPTTRRGGGHIEISGGELYRLPMVLAILNVINFSVPRKEAIQDARADFFVVGNRVSLEDILLHGKGLALAGSGEMMLPGRRVDINLISVSPHEWMRIPALTAMVEGASRNLVEVHIVGAITNPLVRARPFRGLQEEIKRLFKKKAKKPKSRAS